MQAWLALLCCGLAAGLLAQQPATEEGRSRFGAVDIYVDSGSTPLAAYQIELAVTNVPARIVGIEGGEHAAFAPPPYFDSAAMQHERVILAAFSTRPAPELPSGQTRIATIHLQVLSDRDPQCSLQVQTAAGPDGTKIPLTVVYKQRTP